MSGFIPEGVLPLVPLVVLAVLGLVQLVRSFGVQGRILTAVSFLIGCVYGTVLFFVQAPIVTAVTVISLFGLAACGLYDFGNLIGSAIKSIAPKQ